MNEEILLRLGYDASAVRRGTALMLNEQKRASAQFVQMWRQASNEVEREEIIRGNKARRLLRERHTERVSQWKKELSAQRLVRAEAKNLLGVNIENLRKNVGGGRGGLGHGVTGNSMAMREVFTVMREASRGNWTRVPGSLSLIIQSMGKLGKVAAAIVNPITGLIAGLAAGAAVVYKIGANARQTIRSAGEVGFSTTGYQSFLRQAGREPGGREAGQSVLNTFAGNVAGLREGDLGQLNKFRRFGIATTGAGGGALSNEQIFSNVLSKYEGMGDPAKRAAMAMEIFGSGYKKIIKTLDEGSGGLQAAMGKGVQTAGNLAVLSQVGQTVGDAWTALKQGLGETGNAILQGYGKYAGFVNPNLRRLEAATNESVAIDQREQQLIASGRIKPHNMSQHEFELLHPELAAQFKEATMRQEDVQAELADRGKLGLGELAAEGRRLGGHIRPRQFAVTARMRTAMKIDDLEAAATIAWERGNDKQMQQLRGEADAMRKANPWLKLADKDPTRKINEQLIQANKALADIQAMAKFVLSSR